MSQATDTTPPRLPPFRTLLKSRDVEDPVNLWMHRPLAYAFVWLIFRTSITPNQVTVLSLLVGWVAAGCWVVGTPQMMVAGGVLLWTSAILDGADGILARAKQSFSDLGRALDGTADAMVATATVLAAIYHLWIQHQSPLQVAFMIFAIITTVMQIYLYDFYQQSYLQMTNPQWSGEPERLADAKEQLARLKREKAPWTHVFAADTYVSLMESQIRVVGLTNPHGAREPYRFHVDEASVETYRKLNRGPMRLWIAVSLAPHTYVMSICAMFDRLDVYLWIRAGLANVIWVAAMLWQRSASRRTFESLEAMGLAPERV